MKNKGKILLVAVLGGALMSGCGGNVSSSESIDGGGTASSTESSTATSTSESTSEDLTEELSDSTKLKERLLLSADRVVTSRRLSVDLSGTIYDDGKTESVSLATEHEGLRTYTETPTGGTARTYVSYTGILGSDYYSVDSDTYGYSNRYKVGEGGTYDQESADSTIELVHQETGLKGTLAYDEALLGMRFLQGGDVESTDPCLHEVEYTVTATDGGYEAVWESYYENTETSSEYYYNGNFLIIASFDEELNLVELQSDATTVFPNEWDASIHAPLPTATPIHRLYELSDIVYAESYPSTDPAHPILANLNDYFVSEVTSASLVSWNASGPGGAFQVGDTVQLDDSSIEYAPSTALNASYLTITGASEDGVLVETEKMGMTATVFGKAGTFDLYIGDEVSPKLGTITVTVSEVDTSGGSNVVFIDWTGYEASEDPASTEENPIYNVTVPYNFNWNTATIRVDDGSQAMLDKIAPAFTDSNVMMVNFIEDPTMGAYGYATMEFYPLMNDTTTTMTITNPDPSKAYGTETITVNFTVVPNA